jgi:putative membrane protein
MVLWPMLGLMAVLALLVAAALGTVWLVRHQRSDRPDRVGPHEDNARELLRRRYAAGELGDEEYTSAASPR